jgi:KDO2-lipid IV(A) lauroyltransferase
MKVALLKPRYWPTWLLLGFMRVAILLPLGAQLAIGRVMGRTLRLTAPRRWHIALVNLERCFPEMGAAARRRLALRHFDSLGMAFMEFGLCWWASKERLERWGSVEGLEHLAAARAQGHGVILLSAHFTTLEVCGRLLSLHTDLHLMYRPIQNPVIEHVMRVSRERHFDRAIPRNEVRQLLKSLKEGKPVWYATDQGYRGKDSRLIPFFGIPAPTNTVLTRLAKTSSAPVVPFFAKRLSGTQGYHLKVGPILEGFPSDDPDADALRVNAWLESCIREAPEQYLWIHDRFKIVPRD